MTPLEAAAMHVFRLGQRARRLHDELSFWALYIAYSASPWFGYVGCAA